MSKIENLQLTIDNFYASLAQLLEQLTRGEQVEGSSSLRGSGTLSIFDVNVRCCIRYLIFDKFATGNQIENNNSTIENHIGHRQSNQK